MSSAKEIADRARERRRKRLERTRAAAQKARDELLNTNKETVNKYFIEAERELGRRLTPAEKLAALAKLSRVADWKDIDAE